LREFRKSGVFRAAEPPADLESAAQAVGLRSFIIDASAVRTKSQMLGLLGRSLAFPSWYGRNWDALEDCLTDNGWVQDPGLVIRFEGFEPYAEADPNGFGILLDIFKTSAEFWRCERKGFWVFFTGRPAARLELPVLLL
jgi:RNAse (barnase) inhibitor barstar